VTGFDPAGPCPEGVTPAASAAEAVRGMRGGHHHAAERRDPARGIAGSHPRRARRALLLDCSTVDVDSARAVAAKAAAAGLLPVDAPVSGGTAARRPARSPSWPAARPRPSPGPGPSSTSWAPGRPLRPAGNGQAAKICNNMILGVTMIATCEAFALADRLGLDRQAMYDVVSTSSGSCWSLTTYCPAPGIGPKTPADNDYRPGFAAELMLKDLRLSQQAAEAVERRHPHGRPCGRPGPTSTPPSSRARTDAVATSRPCSPGFETRRRPPSVIYVTDPDTPWGILASGHRIRDRRPPMLKKNEGTVDRALRVIAGLALLAAFFAMPEASYRWAFLIGIVPLATGLIGSCPLYTVLGINTCPVRKA
jgi:3-hydroxyisobutyrate dehydrogenase